MTTPATAAHASAQALTQKVVPMRLSLIELHPANVREDLGDLGDLSRSIRQHGILQPLTVQPHPERSGRYRLLAGHRRYEAAQLSGLDAVPVIVRHGVDDGQALELMLVENCQRRELGPMERAEAIGALLNRGYSQADVCRKIGKSSSWVATYATLLELDDASREKVRSGELQMGTAINAIRRTRAKRAKAAGKKPVDRTWEPDHFTTGHGLAKKARALCDAREHTMRRRIGDVACGQCWETAIRSDERIVAAAASSAIASRTSPAERAG